MKTILLASIILSASFLHGDLLFSDSFETYVNKETNSIGAPSPTWSTYNTDAYVTNSAASVGSQSMYIRNGSPQFSYIQQNAAVTISGDPDALIFSFDLKGTYRLASHEGLSSFAVDFGSGFETLITDKGALEGGNHTYTGTTLTLSTTASSSTAPFISYAITVPKSYYGDVLSATTFKTKLSTTSGWSNLNFYVDNIAVNSVIPEPSSLMLMMGGFGALFAGLRVRKKRS